MHKYEVVYHAAGVGYDVICTTKTRKEADAIIDSCNGRNIAYVDMYVRVRKDIPYKGHLLFVFFPCKDHPSVEFEHDIIYDYDWDEATHDSPNFAINATSYEEAHTQYLQWLESDAYKKQIEHYTAIDNAKGWGEYYEGEKK